MSEDVANGSTDRDDGLLRWSIVALTIVGGIIRLLVARQDLFADELATYWIVSTRGLGGVVETVATTAEISPPLSFMMSWLTTRIGLGPELVRLPALVAGVASIPLVYAVGVRTVGRHGALLAAALVTLSPFMIFYSAEARGYGVLMGLVLLSTLTLLLAVDDDRWRWWVAHGACVCLVAYTHYTAIFVLAAQFGWALWVHPVGRRRLVVVTGAASLLYVPWLPSLKGDIDSPTTKILDKLSPFDLDSVRLALEHWTLGYPFALPHTTLRDLPGAPAIALVLAGLLVGIVGAFSARSRLRSWITARRGGVVFVILLAVATPAGAAAQSWVGNNVFSVRSLAASLPYLALGLSALLTVGGPALRNAAAGLVVTAFAIGATLMITNEGFQRPAVSELADFANGYPGGVVVEGVALTPGPLTNFDVEGSRPDLEVFRLAVPEQKTTPFSFRDTQPDPIDVAERAVAAADGGAVILVVGQFQLPAVAEFLDNLPDSYRLSATLSVDALISLEAQVYEQDQSG